MSLENLQPKKIEIEFQQKKYPVEFKIRNFAALKDRYNITENELLTALSVSDISKLPFAIWCSTLVFAKFDPSDPFKIEEEINLEDLFNINISDIAVINSKLVAAMNQSLSTEDSKKAEKKPRAK